MAAVGKYVKGVLGSSAATLLTVPASKIVTVREVVLHNRTTGDLNFTLSHGLASSSDNLMYSTAPIGAKETVQLVGQTIMAAGDVLQGLASAAASVNYFVSYVEVDV